RLAARLTSVRGAGALDPIAPRQLPPGGRRPVTPARATVGPAHVPGRDLLLELRAASSRVPGALPGARDRTDRCLHRARPAALLSVLGACPRPDVLHH